MYRMFCESFPNVIEALGENNYRGNMVKILELIVDVQKYNEEKEKESEIYKKLCDLIIYMEENIEKYPRFKAFLWTIEGKGIIGKRYNISKKEDLEELAKLVNSILKLAYWYQ